MTVSRPILASLLMYACDGSIKVTPSSSISRRIVLRHISQVILALLVIGFYLAERCDQLCALKTVNSCVNLAYLSLLFSGVLLFDDSGKATGIVANHAAVTG